MTVVVVVLVECVMTVSTVVFAGVKPLEGTTWLNAYPEMKNSKRRTVMTLRFANFRVLLEELNISYGISFQLVMSCFMPDDVMTPLLSV